MLMRDMDHFMPGDWVVISSDRSVGKKRVVVVSTAFLAVRRGDVDTLHVGYGFKALRGDRRVFIEWHDSRSMALKERIRTASNIYDGYDGQLPVRLGYQVKSVPPVSRERDDDAPGVVTQFSLFGNNLGQARASSDPGRDMSNRSIEAYYRLYGRPRSPHSHLTAAQWLQTVPSFYLALQHTGCWKFPPLESMYADQALSSTPTQLGGRRVVLL